MDVVAETRHTEPMNIYIKKQGKVIPVTGRGDL
jgi:hypothetical protein